MPLLESVRSLWPLSESFEYAAEVGLWVRTRKPAWWNQFIAEVPAGRFGGLVQAHGFAFLQWCERAADDGELSELCAGAIASAPVRLYTELDASLDCMFRDWESAGDPFSPVGLGGEPVSVFAPSSCAGYPAGASAPLDRWTQVALHGATVDERDADSATLRDLARVHSGMYVKGLDAFAAAGGGLLTPETMVCENAMSSVLASAGAVMGASRLALRGELDGPAVCLVRPGSHHAERGRGGGTCLVNNLAVAAADALARGARRVAVVDIDAHHGNGTEDIFRRDERVFTFSIHQAGPFFPGTGSADVLGEGRARGTNLNVPVGPGEEWMRGFERGMRAVAEHRPQLILVEFSTDAHRADPVSDLGLSDDEFARAVALIEAVGVPVVYELGASLSERAWVGGVRALIAAAAGVR